MMQLADLLKERVDMDCDEVWENERSPTPPQAVHGATPLDRIVTSGGRRCV